MFTEFFQVYICVYQRIPILIGSDIIPLDDLDEVKGDKKVS